MKKKLGLGLILSLAFVAGSCTELAEAFDCVNVCDEYDICFNEEDFDVSECTMSCEDQADLSDAFALQVQTCETCMDAMGCTEVFGCVDECAGIVP